MPLNEDLLAQEMLSAIGGQGSPERTAAFKALARAIVKHIQTNGLVTLQPGTTANGVTAGGAAVPVTGTGKIT